MKMSEEPLKNALERSVRVAPTVLDIINLTASFTNPTANLTYIVALFQFPVIPRKSGHDMDVQSLTYKVMFPFTPPLR